jgi:GNAT superfamily N-acetyltransferase
VSESDTQTIEHLIELGNVARKTLGLLPKAVYFDAAQKGFLLVARDAMTPVGYVLFRLPRNEVVLTHLCVSPEYRKRGVGHKLVQEVSRRHQGRIGIRAKCRDDYTDIAKVWRGLGFGELGFARGRGKDRAAMTVWWLDHGHPNLFTPIDEAPVLRVAIDINILMDLKIRPDHASAERSQVLLAPEVDSNIEMVVSRGLERDIERHPEDLRARLVGAASTFTRPVEQDPSRVQELFDALLSAVQARHPSFPKTPQDTGDLWQLADAAASGLEVFLTWDRRLCNEIARVVLQIEGTPELSRLRIIDPDHLVIHLDELAHAAAYQPRALEGTHFSTELAGSESEATLMTFLNKAGGETSQELRLRLRAVTKIVRSVSIDRDHDQTPVGCRASLAAEGVLRVPLLRVADHPIAETMARRMLWSLRQTAREQGAQVIKIEDPYMTPLLSRAASHEQYQPSENTGTPG